MTEGAATAPLDSGNTDNGLVIITGPFYFWRQQRVSNAPPGVPHSNPLPQKEGTD